MIVVTIAIVAIVCGGVAVNVAVDVAVAAVVVVASAVVYCQPDL